MKFKFAPDLSSPTDTIEGNIVILDDADWQDILKSHDRFHPQHHQTIGAFKLEAKSSEKELKLGESGQFAIGLGGDLSHGSSLEVIYPGEAIPDDLKHALEAPPPEGSIILVMRSSSAVSVSAGASGPIATGIKAALSLKADARFDYLRTQAYAQDSEVAKTLKNFLGHLRWPLRPLTSDPGWTPGDTATFRFEGGLETNLSVQAGYTLEHSESLSLAGIQPTLTAQVGIAAKVTGGINAHGVFAVTTQAGQEPNWVRVMVRRDETQGRNFGVSLDAKLKTSVTEFYQNSNQLAQALFGLDPSNVLEWIEALASDANGDLTAIKAKLTQKGHVLAAGKLDDMVDEVFSWAGQNLPVDRIQGLAADLSGKLRELQELDNHLIARLVRETADERAKAESAIDGILTATSGPALRQWLETQATAADREWLFALLGDRVVDFVTEQPAFRKLISALGSAREILQNPTSELTQFTQHFDRFLEEQLSINQVIEELQAIEQPAQLKALLTGKLGSLTEKMLRGVVDTGAGVFQKKDLERAQKAARAFLKFTARLDKELQRLAVNEAQLAAELAFSRTGAEEALIDVEIDVSQPAGQAAYRDLMRGKIGNLLVELAPYARVHAGAVKTQSARTRALGISVAGWQFEHILATTLQSEVSPIYRDGTRVGVNFATTGSSQEEKRRGGKNTLETFRSNLLLKLSAESLQPSSLAGTAPATQTALNSSYNYVLTDALPHWDELPEYLNLAQQLGILTDPTAFVQSVREEAKEADLEQLSISYRILLDPTALGKMFDRWTGEEDIAPTVREVVRAYFKDRFKKFSTGTLEGIPFNTYCAITAYDFEGVRKVRRQNRSIMRVKLTLEDGRTTTVNAKNPSTLYRLLQAETDFVDALVHLDSAILELGTASQLTAPVLRNATQAIGDLLAVRHAGQTGSYWADHMLFLALHGLCENAAATGRNIAVMHFEAALPNGTSLKRTLST